MAAYPDKLRQGSHIRVVAPSCSMQVVSEECRRLATSCLESMGLRVSFGRHTEEYDAFESSSVQSRIEDLHEAFADRDVDAIITVIGGWSSNQLLRRIDWDVIKNNPKIFCGFSDITALNNSIYAGTGLVTYSGPHWSTFGQEKHLEYTVEGFRKCLFENEPYEIVPCQYWSNDEWWNNQKDRILQKNDGWLVINEGSESGTILGGNLCTFNLLQGTEYFPDLKGSVLFLEDDWESQPHTFDRDLQSLIHQPGFAGVRGIVIGRFEKDSNMSDDVLTALVRSKPELERLPIVANVDFGHTDPKLTFPIGGAVELRVAKVGSRVRITRH